MSIRLKLFGAISAILCLVLGVVVLLSVLAERERTDRERALERFTVELVAGLASPQHMLTRSPLLQRSRLHPELRTIAVFRAQVQKPEHAWGTLERLAEGDPDAVAEFERARGIVSEAFRTQAPVVKGRVLAVPTIPADLAENPSAEIQWVTYAVLRDPPSAAWFRVGQIQFLLILGAGVVLIATLWWLLDRLVLRPLRQIDAAAVRIAHGDYSEPVPGTGRKDEMQRVVRTFNSMMLDLAELEGRLKDRVGDALQKAKDTQETLVIAQRLASTGRLAAGIAHEVNNPLNGLLNAVHSLKTKELPPAKRAEYFELVEEGLRRIQATVAKILQFRPHKVAPRAVRPSDVVLPVVALARHRIERLGAEAAVEDRSGDADVFGDPYELQQALLNVVLNALDAVEEAGRPQPRLTLSIDADESEVRFLVRDNGTGMKEEDIGRAFDLFFTTKEPGKGTGLGLAMVHKIATDHGGRVRLASRGASDAAGPGLDVEIALPRFRPAP